MICYEASSPNFFWQIFIFAYLVVLQIIGIILSFQTRKVKVQGLRDSKYIATIIYISSIVIVVLALVTFSLRTYINIGTGIFVAGIFILTTIFLALIFIPKVLDNDCMYNHRQKRVSGNTETVASLENLQCIHWVHTYYLCDGFSMCALCYGTINLVAVII